jgi:hypothetical protein
VYTHFSELGVWTSEFVDCFWRVVLLIHSVIGMGKSMKWIDMRTIVICKIKR